MLKWLLRGVQCTDGMTFQTCYVHVPKCLLVSKVKYKQNPNLNEVLMHRMTPCDVCMQSGLNLISQLSWTCAWLFIITVKRAKRASSNETWFQEKSIGKVCELRLTSIFYPLFGCMDDVQTWRQILSFQCYPPNRSSCGIPVADHIPNWAESCRRGSRVC